MSSVQEHGGEHPEAGLGQRLRLATKDVHRRVEQAGVMGQLLHGKLPFERYRLLLLNLRQIYRALESAIATQNISALAPTWLAQLSRGVALDHDLAALGSDPALAAAVQAPSTAALCERIARAEHDPARLLAHAYVRYLGDLNGGQILKRLVYQSYGAITEHALTFYEFGSPEDVSRLSARFRATLAQIPDADNAHQRIVAEALAAFELHAKIFLELATVAI